MKSAIKLIITSGIEISPEILNFLSTEKDPTKIAKEIVINFTNKERIEIDDLISMKKEISNPSKNNNQSLNELDDKLPRIIVTSKYQEKNQFDIESRIQANGNSISSYYDNLDSSLGRKVPRRIFKNELDSQMVVSKTYSYEKINSKKGKTIHESDSLLKSHTVINTSLDDLKGLNNFESKLEIVFDPQPTDNFIGNIEDIVGYFQDRYRQLSQMFLKRSDISNITKIKDIHRNEGEISVIGMLTEKQFPKSGGAVLFLEDPSVDRVIEAIIPKNDSILVEECLQLMDDTVLCVVGYLFKGTFIAKEILLPDIPNIKKRRVAEIPVHVAFLSDIHIGSKNFIEKPFDRFIDFLNGKYGNRQMQALGLQTKYIMFSGDVVDGVGIYPDQIDDLEIQDIKEQYETFVQKLEKIPEDVEMVIIPGNHDMVRSAEPQPRIAPQYAPALDSFKNVHMLSNPSQIALHGIQILLYHCTSLPDISNHIPGTQIDKPVEIMKHMLKARHLAPIWGSKTPIATEPKDYLVINQIPDIFHGGHVHINGEGNYKGIQIINSGTMQAQTNYQKTLNIVPTPGQVTITNLKDYRINKINFM